MVTSGTNEYDEMHFKDMAKKAVAGKGRLQLWRVVVARHLDPAHVPITVKLRAFYSRRHWKHCPGCLADKLAPSGPIELHVDPIGARIVPGEEEFVEVEL